MPYRLGCMAPIEQQYFITVVELAPVEKIISCLLIMEPKQDKWVGEFSDWCDGVLSAPLHH